MKHAPTVGRKGGRITDAEVLKCIHCNLPCGDERERRRHQRTCDAREGEQPEEKSLQVSRSASSNESLATSEISNLGDEIKAQHRSDTVADVDKPPQDEDPEQHHSVQQASPAGVQQAPPASILQDPSSYQKHKSMSPLHPDFNCAQKTRLNALPKPNDKIWSEINAEAEQALDVILPNWSIKTRPVEKSLQKLNDFTYSLLAEKFPPKPSSSSNKVRRVRSRLLLDMENSAS